MAFNNRLISLIVICIPILTLGFTAPLSSVAVRRISTTNLFAKSNDQNEDESLSSNTSNNNINRRSAIQQTSSIALSSLLLGTSGVLLSSPLAANAAETYEDTKKKQRILITGCNSGIGFDAAERLAMRGHEIVLACVSIVCCCGVCVRWMCFVY